MIELGKLNKCSGCTACSNICPKGAITFANSSNGFLYPTINQNKCIECHLCEKICPWLTAKSNPTDSNVFIAAKRSDFKKRMKSQSGGAFSVFAESFYKKKGIVYGVEYFKNKAQYTRTSSLGELKKLRGSKYVQAEVGHVFNDVEKDLISNKKVLFSGTACHVDGLYKYLNAKKVDCRNLTTIDIICHGVVSPKLFKDYLSFVTNLHKGKLKWFNFRDKSFGWHGHYITYKIGHNIYKSKDYVNLFYSSYALRNTCYECQYANLKRVSDITIGDCWGIGDHFPDYDDNKGCSLIILNSSKGKEIFECNKNQFETLEISKAQALQPNLANPTEIPGNYDSFWDDYKKFGFEYVAFKYCNFNPRNESIILRKHNIFKRIHRKVCSIFGVNI